MPELTRLQTLLASGEATTRLARWLAPRLVAGDCILLQGEIGAGKSHFARALIEARLAVQGLSEKVPSPTFTLVQTYDDGLAEIWHTDLYRLNGPADIDELGLWEAFDSAICLVEWPDRLGPYAPKNALRFKLSPTAKPGERLARLSFSSPVWHDRLKGLGMADVD